MSQTTTTSSFWLRYRRWFHHVILFAAIWFILSGKLEPIYIFWGVLSIAIVMWFSERLHKPPFAADEPRVAAAISIPRLVFYLIWLLGQIIKSGVYVAYVILHPRMPIGPTIVCFTSTQPNVFARVILGNSITLTPGTLTVDIEDNRFTVHALTRDTEEGLVSGGMQGRVARMYSREFEAEDMGGDIELTTSERRG